MTALTHPARVSPGARGLIAAVALFIVARLLLTGGDDEPVTWSDVLASLAFTGFALAIALVVVLPRAERADAASAAAVGLAVLGLATLPMFWFSGAPFALGASAFALARTGAAGGRRRAAMGVGAFAAAVNLLIALAVTVSQFDPTLPQ